MAEVIAAVEAKRASGEAARRVIAQREAALLALRTQLSEAEQNNPRQLLLREATVQMRKMPLQKYWQINKK